MSNTVKLINSLENVFRLLKNLLNNFELTTIPSLIRGACSKQNSLIVCMDLLNHAFKQIQHMTTSNSTASVDDTCQEVYQQLRSSWASSDKIFDTFLNLSDSFDDLDKELNNIYTLFQTLDIPLANIDNDLHQQFLTNFFAMSKIATMRHVCQLIIDHSQTFNNVKSQITNDGDISTIIVQYLADLLSLAMSYLIFSLIPSSQSILENTFIQTDNQFQDFMNSTCLITPTNQLAEIQQILAQINDIKTSIVDDLTTDQNILTISDSTSTVVIDKTTNLEQTNDKQLCLHLVKILQSWLLFEQYEEQIKLQRDLIIHARTFAEKGLEICLLKTDIESNFTIVEQAVLEFPPVENLKQITLQNLPSLIEQAEHECVKHKRNRIKEERELENPRDEKSHLISELKSLLKIIPHRALQNYSNIHREFLELCHTVVKHTLHVDTNSSLKYDARITKIKRLITIKTKVFDDLIQLNPTIDNENRKRTSSSTVNTSTQDEVTDKTTKVTEERNKYAVEICKRIRDKLDGSDPDPLTQSSISGQVRYTVREATDIENLATLYEGWTSWV
ncbi:unnamed protein product [Rotaria socialis]|nr:unnamed protein product [Rotaria socialis]